MAASAPLFRPRFWLDLIYRPLVEASPERLLDIAADRPEDASLALRPEGLLAALPAGSRARMRPLASRFVLARAGFFD